VLVLDPNSEFFKYFRNPGRAQVMGTTFVMAFALMADHRGVLPFLLRSCAQHLPPHHGVH